MKEKLFRLSALLFDEGYETRNKSLQKIISFIFIDNSNQIISIKEIKEQIINEFELVFNETEIIDALKKDETRFNLSKINNEYKCNLGKEYYRILEQDYINNKTINYFVRLFYNDVFDCKREITEKKFEELLYTFLFDVYNGERSKISSLFNINKVVVPTTNFTDEEVKWINSFLTWDNEDKNESIYQLAALALEYCMISSNADASIMNNVINGKIFYLDTNIIMRLIGIGGERRFSQVSYFLEKIKSFDCQIKIGQNVVDEFNRVMNRQIYKIQHFLNGGSLVPPSLCIQTMDETMLGFYTLFYEWFKIKQSKDLKLFAASIDLKFEEHLIEYNIEIDFSFETENIKNTDKYKTYCESLSKYKVIDEDTYFMESVYSDVTSIINLEKLRNNKSINISETREILISTDGKLINWRKQNSNDRVSLISKPSIWINIILRFSERYTKDDLECFINYIQRTPNLGEEKIDIEKYKKILKKILTYTDILEEQNTLLNKVIERYSINMLNELDSEDIDEEIDTMLQSEHKKLVDEQIKEIQTLANRRVDESLGKIKNLENVITEQRKDMINLKDEVSKIEITNMEYKDIANNKNTQLIQFWNGFIISIWIIFAIFVILPLYLIVSRILSYGLDVFPLSGIIDTVGNDFVYYVISCALFAIPPVIKKYGIDIINSKIRKLKEENI